MVCSMATSDYQRNFRMSHDLNLAGFRQMLQGWKNIVRRLWTAALVCQRNACDGHGVQVQRPHQGPTGTPLETLKRCGT